MTFYSLCYSRILLKSSSGSHRTVAWRDGRHARIFTASQNFRQVDEDPSQIFQAEYGAVSDCSGIPHSQVDHDCSISSSIENTSDEHFWQPFTATSVHVATVATIAATLQALFAGSGNSSNISSWESLIGSFTAFFILSSIFTEDGEAAGTLCYATGLLGMWTLLLQSFLVCKTPLLVFALTTVLVVTALSINFLKASGFLSDFLWTRWRAVGGFVGYSVLPQVALMAAGQQQHRWFSAGGVLLALGGAAVVFWGQQQGTRGQKVVQDYGAWCATWIFMLEPIGALVSC